MHAEENKLERVKLPEEVGVDSDVVYSFLKEIKSLGINMHSMMILRHGKVAVECCRYPYKSTAPMAMFSLSKGITSTAVGIAVNEGLLSLEDKISDYFPYECRSKRDRERYKKVTVYDLLTHRSGKFLPPMYNSEKRHWDELWLSAPFSDEPGTKFSYISENTYMLAKLLYKITGETVEQYLTPRLFEPMKIKTPYWESDHDGCSAGGWGAFLTIEDMAKIGHCYLQMGKWNGKQLIPESWIRLATQSHVKNIPSVFQKNICYGFQMFVLPTRHTYSFNGLYGQYVVVFPEYDAVFAYTSGDCDEYAFMHTLYKYFPKAFSDDISAQENNQLADHIYALEHPITNTGIRSRTAEQAINGKTIKIKRTKPYASIIGPSTTYMLSKKSGKIDNIKFNFDENKLTMLFTEDGCGEQAITASLQDKYDYSEITIGNERFETAAKATWLKDTRLQINIIPLESAQERALIFDFHKNRVHIHANATPGFYDLFKFYLRFNGIKRYYPLIPGMKVAGAIANRAFNPNYNGILTG